METKILFGYLLLLPIVVGMLLFRKSRKKEKPKQPLSLPPVAERIRLARMQDLECYQSNLTRLFYSEDGKTRLLFLTYDDHVSVVKEIFELYDEEDISFLKDTCNCWQGDYGLWYGDNDFHSLYASMDIALKEWEYELKNGYIEENIS